jgi:NAD+ diphosphatase
MDQVTFGGSGLDRAADLRTDVAALVEAMQAPGARTVVLWRGKPLVEGLDDRDARLARLPLDHPVLAEARDGVILLGRENGEAVFCHDISGWAPPDLDPTLLGAFADPTEQAHPDCAPGQRFAELRRVMTWLKPRDAELAATAKAIRGWHATHGFCARCGAVSDMQQAGWQRVCATCGAHHFPRTDPVVIMLITRGNRCLLGRSPGWPEGMYSCLAGFVEPGETPEAAVRREVMEEAGIAVGRVRYVASQPWPFPASLMIGCHGEALDDEIQLDPAELEDARWITREALADVFAGLSTDMLPARKGAIAHYLLRHWLSDTLE